MYGAVEDKKEISTPNDMKILLIQDLIEHNIKQGKLITPKTFYKYNISNYEYNWIEKYYGEKIKMENEQLLQKYKNKIKELEEQLQNTPQTNQKPKTKIELIDKTFNIWGVEINSTRKGKSIKTTHYVYNKELQRLKQIIKLLADKNGETKYYDVAQIIIHSEKLDCTLDAFNGGKNRKYYFKHYYYPIKVLEHTQYIEYNKKGIIKIIK